MSRAQVNVPLNIPDVRVIKSEINQRGELIITIESTKPGTTCRICGRWIEKLHGHDDWTEIRHLPVFGRPSYLRYRPKRYQCLQCEGKPTSTQKLDWRDNNSPHSFVYDEHLLLQLVGSTVEDVSIKEDVGYDAVLGVMERRIDKNTDWSRYTELGTIGIDEIALKKGHRDFVVVVSVRLKDGRLVVLGVLKNREKDTVIAFLRSIPQRLSETIQTVCCDMYEGFSEAVKQELKSTMIVVDRFHVARHYRDAADDVRQEELRRLKKELPAEEYQQMKGSMWAFRKHPADLKPEERTLLRALFKHSPAIKQAYTFREELTAIFEKKISKPRAERKIKAWIKRVQASSLTCFNKFISTLENWWTEITNFFIARDNSGFVEGLNNKIKVLKRRCYGIFNREHLFQRIWLDLEGYRLFAPQPPHVA